MKAKFLFSLLAAILLYTLPAIAQEIPIEYLSMKLQKNKQEYSKPILVNSIEGVNVEHVALSGRIIKNIDLEKGNRTIYLFVKGYGKLISNKKTYDIVPETILLPNTVENISFNANENDTLHYLKISVILTKQDILDLQEFPEEHTQNIYFAKFTDCKAYTEAIKSPQTTSRTILPNKYIPRVAMGTVETIGPDKVGAHEHPMLEQLFLGLTNNQTIVFADDAQVFFPPYTVLHIPLGSSHSVEVKENSKMYYVWMDFFLDKKGEEWLKTHKTKDE